MRKKTIKQLNAFEIKREIARVIEALESSTVLIDETEFKTLDAQEDKQSVVKVLMKEFYLCKEENMQVLKLLLFRYYDSIDNLLNDLESIIKNPKNPNNLKLHAIDFISSFRPNWHDANYEAYLEYDEELIQNETRELLEDSGENPEIQIDFLDFFSAIQPDDQMMLLESLNEDQQGKDIANILVPIFLSAPDNEIGHTALKMLRNTKSAFAYESLNQTLPALKEDTQRIVKKCLTELKLSGANRNFNPPKDAHEYAKFYIIPPDGEGNFSLLYKNMPIKEKTVQLISIVIDDYTGIRECLGFNAISAFEADFLLEKFVGTDLKTEISPGFFKMLLQEGEKLNYTKDAPPYEYSCWKRIFLDIEPENIDIEEVLTAKFKNSVVKHDDFDKIYDSDFTEPWFYNHNFGDETEDFFSALDKLLKNKPIEQINLNKFLTENIDNVIYPKEKENWKQRLLLTAYCELQAGYELPAKYLFNMTRNEQEMRNLYEFILRQSVLQYFLKMREDKNFLKYKKKKLEEIISYLEELWGFICLE